MKKLVMLSAVLAIATASFSQKVNNKISFIKGAKLEVTTTLSTVAEIMGGEVNTNASSVRILDIEEVKEGVATVESKMKRLTFSFEGMGQSQSFDSENEKDMKGEMGKVAEKGLKNKYSMRLDSKGTIMDVVADDDNPNGKDKEAPMDPMMGMMEGIVGGLDLPKAGSRIELAILPEKELAKGDSWSDNSSAIKEMQRKATYTISEITEDQILVDFTEESAGKMVRENMGVEITIDQTEKSTGKIIIDRSTGLLKQKTTTKQTEGTMEVMGQTMPINSKSTITEIVTTSR